MSSNPSVSYTGIRDQTAFALYISKQNGNQKSRQITGIKSIVHIVRSTESTLTSLGSFWTEVGGALARQFRVRSCTRLLP